MIDRREVAFFDIVAAAGLADPPQQIDTEAVYRVARPAAAVALQLKCLFRGEDAAASRALGVEQKVAFFAEQAEAVADFPGNLHRGVGAALCYRPLRRQRRQRGGQQRACDYRTEAISDHDPFDVTVGAEIREGLQRRKWAD